MVAARFPGRDSRVRPSRSGMERGPAQAATRGLPARPGTVLESNASIEGLFRRSPSRR
jgi:hypothetical protein